VTIANEAQKGRDASFPFDRAQSDAVPSTSPEASAEEDQRVASSAWLMRPAPRAIGSQYSKQGWKNAPKGECRAGPSHVVLTCGADGGQRSPLTCPDDRGQLPPSSASTVGTVRMSSALCRCVIGHDRDRHWTLQVPLVSRPPLPAVHDLCPCPLAESGYLALTHPGRRRAGDDTGGHYRHWDRGRGLVCSD
jgi:hypothetical protein